MSSEINYDELVNQIQSECRVYPQPNQEAIKAEVQEYKRLLSTDCSDKRSGQVTKETFVQVIATMLDEEAKKKHDAWIEYSGALITPKP